MTKQISVGAIRYYLALIWAFVLGAAIVGGGVGYFWLRTDNDRLYDEKARLETQKQILEVRIEELKVPVLPQ